MNTQKFIKGLRMPWALTSKSRSARVSQHNAAAVATEDALSARRRSGSTKKKAESRKDNLRQRAEAQAAASIQWSHEHKNVRASRLGFYDPAAPGVLSSTRQMEFSHMAIASPPTSHRGFAFGIDAGSGWMIVHDPFTSYGNELESPNVCFIGDLGQEVERPGVAFWCEPFCFG